MGVPRGRLTEAVYELVLHQEEEKVVLAEEPIDVGDAVVIDDEIWLVLRESEPALVRGRPRFECRRGLRLRNHAQELLNYAKELEAEAHQGARGERSRLVLANDLKAVHLLDDSLAGDPGMAVEDDVLRTIEVDCVVIRRTQLDAREAERVCALAEKRELRTLRPNVDELLEPFVRSAKSPLVLGEPLVARGHAHASGSGRKASPWPTPRTTS
jgi:hypothetical protein